MRFVTFRLQGKLFQIKSLATKAAIQRPPNYTRNDCALHRVNKFNLYQRQSVRTSQRTRKIVCGSYLCAMYTFSLLYSFIQNCTKAKRIAFFGIIRFWFLRVHGHFRLKVFSSFKERSLIPSVLQLFWGFFFFFLSHNILLLYP